jgi:hypothetical protein
VPLSGEHKLRSATLGISGGEMKSSRGRFAAPAGFSLSRIVPRIEGYTYDANVWDLSIVQFRAVFYLPVPDPDSSDSQHPLHWSQN